MYDISKVFDQKDEIPLWLKYDDNGIQAAKIDELKWMISGFMKGEVKIEGLAAIVETFTDEVCDAHRALQMENLPLWYTDPLPLPAASKDFKVMFPKYWVDGPMVKYYFEEILGNPYGPEGVVNEDTLREWKIFEALLNHVDDRFKSLTNDLKNLYHEGRDQAKKAKGGAKKKDLGDQAAHPAAAPKK